MQRCDRRRQRFDLRALTCNRVHLRQNKRDEFVLGKIGQRSAIHRIVESRSPRGSGGTDFKPVLDWIAKSYIQPVCIAYLIDLCRRAFWPPPDYPVQWISMELNRAPFGEVTIQ